MLGVLNSKIGHAILEVLPRDGSGVVSEEREHLGGVLGGSAVGEVEADTDIVNSRIGSVGNQLESHGGCVVDNAHKVRASLVKTSQAEEGHESTVSTELDVHFGRLLALSEGLKSLDDLASQNGASNGTDGLAAIVGKVPLVDRGEVVELVQSRLFEKVVGEDAGVVNACNINEIKDWMG